MTGGHHDLQVDAECIPYRLESPGTLRIHYGFGALDVHSLRFGRRFQHSMGVFELQWRSANPLHQWSYGRSAESDREIGRGSPVATITDTKFTGPSKSTSQGCRPATTVFRSCAGSLCVCLSALRLPVWLSLCLCLSTGDRTGFLLRKAVLVRTPILGPTLLRTLGTRP